MATAAQASELKQQGVIDAAKDPDSGLTAEAAQNTVVKEAKKGGSAAFQFDPDASVEDKREQARSVRTMLKHGLGAHLTDTLYSTSLLASITNGTPMPLPSPQTP
jgi:hypothetical protein